MTVGLSKWLMTEKNKQLIDIKQMQFCPHSILCKSLVNLCVNPGFIRVCSVCAPLKTSFNILMENRVRFTPHSLCGCTTLDTVQVVSGSGHQFLCIQENIV